MARAIVPVLVFSLLLIGACSSAPNPTGVGSSCAAAFRANEDPAGGGKGDLNSAVKACATVEEWKTAWAFFPNSHGSALDPIQYLQGRCIGNGLESTALCKEALGGGDPIQRIMGWAGTYRQDITCASWKQGSAAEREVLAAEFLNAMRLIEKPSAAAASTSQAETLGKAITTACSAGTDCNDPNLYCDTAAAAQAAATSYLMNHDSLKP
jgi:hypothetical protein